MAFGKLACGPPFRHSAGPLTTAGIEHNRRIQNTWYVLARDDAMRRAGRAAAGAGSLFSPKIMIRSCPTTSSTFSQFLARCRHLYLASLGIAIALAWMPGTEKGQTGSKNWILDAGAGPNVPPSSCSDSSQLLDLLRHQRWSEAAKVAPELAKQHPNDPMIFYGLGLARMNLRDAIHAIAALRTAEKLGLDTVALHEALGMSYYTIHQYILFQNEIEGAIRLDPTNYQPFYLRGRYRESVQNDFVGALRDFDKATELNPEDTRSRYYKGYCLQSIGHHGEAREAYESAIRLVETKHERFSLPYQGLAQLLLDAQPERALALARKAVELEPNLDSNHLVTAKIFEQLGRRREAIQELQMAVRLDPTNASPRFMLARIYAKVGNRQSAQTELEMFQKVKELYGAQ